jgi:N-acyl amino acid synthase of PEP-CTERM/exosortase system
VRGAYEAAATRRVKKCALQLRYQVYCLEHNFLSADDYPDGVETDEHDDRAAHFYAFDAAEELVGYVRLVLTNTESRFPFQQHCALSAGVELPPAPKAAEISRLMVRSDYRRRQTDKLSTVTAQQNAAALSGDRRHQSPRVLLTLYRQMYQYSVQHDLQYWYAAMEKPLARSLSRLGFGFTPIGPDTDYYGPVAPYLADVRRLEEQIRQRDPGLLQWLQDAEAKPTLDLPITQPAGIIAPEQHTNGLKGPLEPLFVAPRSSNRPSLLVSV